jgi:RND superfamily putative drug exporter
MFALLGHVVRRGWPFLLAGWGLLLLGTWYAAPPWEKVAHDQEFAFLPKDAPSRSAQEELAKAFPTDRPGSNVVLVLHRAGDQPLHLQDDRKYISDVLEPGLHDIAESEGGLAYEIKPSEEPLFATPGAPPPPPRRSIMARILTPNTPGIGALLVSPDGKEMLLLVELTTDFLADRNRPLLAKIEHLLDNLRAEGQVPPGLEIAMTGSAVVGRDHVLAEVRSVRATEWITIVLVIVLLILIYRAPLLALIPLATVFVARQVSIHLVAILGSHGYLLPFQGLQIYITILAYGAGVDYCLFLTSRYKEELKGEMHSAEAVERTVSAVGAALLASAATVIGGIAMMQFAHFGKFRQAGIAIPLSLALVVCASLTFGPALLYLAGRWAFWPHPMHEAGAIGGSGLRRIWHRVGQMLLHRPATAWLVSAGVMAPFAVVAGLLYNRVSYNLIGDLPADAPSVTGTRLLQAHFPAGMVGPVTVLAVDPHTDFGTAAGRDLVGGLTDQLQEQKAALNLADVRSLTRPLGITKAGEHPTTLGLHVSAGQRREELHREALDTYTTDLGGWKKIGARFDLILSTDPFAHRSIDDLARIEQVFRAVLPADTRLYVAGTTADVRDLADVVRQDRQRIEWLVLSCVLVILMLLLRRLVLSVYLLLSVLFSYCATLGVVILVFWLLDPHGFAGPPRRLAGLGGALDGGAPGKAAGVEETRTPEAQAKKAVFLRLRFRRARAGFHTVWGMPSWIQWKASSALLSSK